MGRNQRTPEEIQANRAARRELVKNFRLDVAAIEAVYREQMRILAPVRTAWSPKPKLRL